MAIDTIFRGKTLRNEEREEGDFFRNDNELFPSTYIGVLILSKDKHTGHISLDGYCLHEVDPDTICRCSGLTDMEGKRIFEGDIVDFFGRRGSVVFECGAFGIYFRSDIDYDDMYRHIYDLTGTMNAINCCFNDNFISLWEIFWNFNCEEGCCHVLEIVGNIYDNPELLPR